MVNLNSIHIWGIKFNLLTKRQIVDFVQEQLSSGRRGLHLTGVNPETVVDAQRIDILREAILDSDIVNVDNMLVMCCLRRCGFDVPERCATPDVFEMMLESANRHGQSVYLLGAEQEVVEKMVENVTKQYPSLRIVGYRNGFFTSDMEPAIVEDIRVLSPDYLFLGLPTPMKESFIMRHKADLNAGVCYGIGGAFDVKGEKVKRAPQWACKIGLEGILRVMQNPRNYGRRITKYYPDFLRIVFAGNDRKH